MSLNKEIKDQLISRGASIVGFADLSSLPKDQTKGLSYGILIGVSVNPEILLSINDGPTLESYEEYKRLNRLLDELDEYTAEILRSKGFSAVPKIKGSVIKDNQTQRTELPHKTIATRAGVGWIGKCALLVTEEYGSGIRISSVLTDAILETGTPITDSKCGNCLECKNACPAGAISGESWNVNIDRDKFYNAINCRNTARERCNKIGINETMCGLCIVKCPWTKGYLRGQRPVK
ncbi:MULTISPECIES: 4Fe-4S double cluster binding domain-containing protein [unclassified Dehalobacter]|uniref:4Fe-4S double cluster binding domain-containing protein n=1 Tax=unclassified Dehalobacter TaxID=2635733 RepID=UPI000E6D4D42|nr:MULTISPECIES: 4Fe-4S double cluster binding domain-containing protein [unclassified Dehalobacter]RJE46565.1 hypothetical protein A7K50_13380 [Dehalobacter sp. MCB1]TCX47874.1 epoxyqueuosine reductase [Dehalobacter sp. 14DCB1]TCX55678.1 epoxyqueuosine reductase [Dehalobacter sp. 12DCB1]